MISVKECLCNGARSLFNLRLRNKDLLGFTNTKTKVRSHRDSNTKSIRSSVLRELNAICVPGSVHHGLSVDGLHISDDDLSIIRTLDGLKKKIAEVTVT